VNVFRANTRFAFQIGHQREVVIVLARHEDCKHQRNVRNGTFLEAAAQKLRFCAVRWSASLREWTR
jgi:hypothetical protein